MVDHDAAYKPKIRIDGVVYVIDVLQRMLRSRELARATDLVDETRGYDFFFAGTEQEINKQIGNAVPSNVMEALTRTLCSDIVGLPEHVPMIRIRIDPAKPDDALGLYREPIIRAVQERAERPPTWFDPREDPTHVAIVASDGETTYLQLAENACARAALHPYEVIVEESDQPTRLTFAFDDCQQSEAA